MSMMMLLEMMSYGLDLIISRGTGISDLTITARLILEPILSPGWWILKSVSWGEGGGGGVVVGDGGNSQSII
jgi:hypothetical protein